MSLAAALRLEVGGLAPPAMVVAAGDCARAGCGGTAAAPMVCFAPTNAAARSSSSSVEGSVGMTSAPSLQMSVANIDRPLVVAPRAGRRHVRVLAEAPRLALAGQHECRPARIGAALWLDLGVIRVAIAPRKARHIIPP